MLYIEPIVGFRTWRLNEDRLALMGKMADIDWEFDRKTCAKCVDIFYCPSDLPSHDAPHPECSCGLYAYASQDLMEERYVGAVHNAYVCGAVIAWGKVCEHEDGWKAQFARPLCLKEEAGRENLVSKIAENYRIPIVPEDMLTQYALSFGPALRS